MNKGAPLPPSTWQEAGVGGAPWAADEAPQLAPGTAVDRYVVEALIGEGGAASVYRVRHKALGIPYALKVLRSREGAAALRQALEGRLQARLRHPNILPILDAFDVDGAPALLMDLIEGPSLAGLLAERRLGPAEAEALFRGIVAGVGHAHRQGVVHRDLKPENVLLATEAGRLVPKVVDFGIARRPPVEADGPALTRTSAFLGTPAYMAPEQIRRPAEVDPRADVFSLGVLLYEMCCGGRPFVGADLLTVLNAIDQGRYEPPEARAPTLPRHLVEVIHGCLVQEVDRRVQSCDVILSLLDTGGAASLPPGPAGALALGPGRVEAQDTALGLPTPSPSGDEAPAAVTLHVRPEGLDGAPVALHPRRRWAAPALLAGVLLGLGALGVRALVGETSRLERRAAHHLAAAAVWDTAPAEALAHLLAAEADPTAGAPGLSRAAVDALVARGAASRVLPAGAQVLALASSPDGALLAAGLMGGRLVVWETATGRRRFAVDADVGRHIAHLRFSTDGAQVFVIPERGANGPGKPTPARSFDTTTGRLRYTYAHGQATTNLHVTPNGERLITAGHDRKVQVWRHDTGAPERTLPFEGGAAEPCAAVSPDSALLALGSAGGLTLYGLEDGAMRWHHTEVGDGAHCRLRFAPDGRHLYWSTPLGAEVYDLTGARVAGFSGPSGDVLEVSPDGVWVLSGARLPQPELRRAGDLGLARALVGLDSGVTLGRFAGGGRLVVAASGDGALVVWETASGRVLQRMGGHTSRIMAMEVFTSEGIEQVATAGRDGTVRLWRLPTGQGRARGPEPGGLEAFELRADGAAVLQVDRERVELFTLDGARLAGLRTPPRAAPEGVALTADGRGASVVGPRTWLLVDGLDDTPVPTTIPLTQWCRFTSFAPDGRRALAFGEQSALLVAERGEGGGWTTWALPLPGVPYRATWTADGRSLWVGTRQGQMARVDLEARRVVFEETVMEGGIAASVWVAGRVVAGGWDGSVWIGPDAGGGGAHRLRGHTDAVVAVAASADGGFVASASWDRTVRVWDTQTWTPRHVFPLGGSDPTALAFDGPGARLAVATRDGAVRVWSTADGAPEPPLRSPLALRELVFRGDGGHLVGADVTGRIWEWDPPEGPAAAPAALAGVLTNLRVCPDGRQVVGVLPYPPASQHVAPPDACVPEEIP